MIIYTVITNGYCSLPKININEKLVCFSDGTVQPQEGWELRDIQFESECPVTLSRHPKINPHLYFDEDTVYIDASRLHLINDEFIKVSEEILNEKHLIVLEHPEQHNYLEECLEYYVRGWVRRDNIVELTNTLKEKEYNFNEHPTIFGCVLWRHNNEEVRAWSELWWELYQTCGPRDQLTGSVSFYMSGSAANVVHPVDIIPKFTPYRNWWYGLNGPTGQYDIGYKQTDWKSFLDQLGLDTSQINLKKIQYLDDIGYRDIFSSMKEELNYDISVSETYFNHQQALVQQRGDYDFIVYTCITNGYDSIPDHYYDPKVRYVLYHDGTIPLNNPNWEYRDVRELCDLECPRRLSSFPKINPHKCFEVGDNTVWIDGCYKMTKEFVEESRKVFPLDLATMEHCYEFTYYDEMLEGFMCEFFSYEDGVEITKKLAEAGYNFKEYCSPCCTMIWRTIRSTLEFNKFCDLWWEWSLIGPNRDQVSFDAARQFSGLEIYRIFNKPPDTVVMGVELKFSEKNKNRKGKHPKRGSLDQWKRRAEFLTEIEPMVGMSTKIHAKFEHVSMMDFNGILRDEVRGEYIRTSPTMRNLSMQQNLWVKREGRSRGDTRIKDLIEERKHKREAMLEMSQSILDSRKRFQERNG